jgi:hypothetical protein
MVYIKNSSGRVFYMRPCTITTQNHYPLVCILVQLARDSLGCRQILSASPIPQRDRVGLGKGICPVVVLVVVRFRTACEHQRLLQSAFMPPPALQKQHETA